MHLLPDEQIINQFGPLILTTHRIIKAQGHEVASVRLEHITHCQVFSTDRPVLILIGAALIAGGIIVGMRLPGAFVFGLILGLSLIAGYLVGRRSEIEVASPTLTIRHSTKSQGVEEAMNFLCAIEHAATIKSERRALLPEFT